MYSLGITGHANIEKANQTLIEDNGNIYNKEVFETVYKEINSIVERIIQNENITKEELIFVSGMARGADEIFALYAMNYNIPIIASIPYKLEWHKNRPPRQGDIRAQAIQYDKIINYILDKQNQGCLYSKINEVPKFYNGEQYKYANFARNQNIIDESDGVMSYFKYSSPGTSHAIMKAKEYNKYIGNVSSYGNNNNILKPFKIHYDTDLFSYPTHIIIQGCNCFNTMGAGIAAIIKKNYPEAYKADLETKKGDREKLGNFTFADVNPNNEKGKVKYIVNAYTQFTHWDKEDMFYIEAFEKSLTKIIEYFLLVRKGKNKVKFSIPAIGLGLANGEIEDIYDVLNKISKKYEEQNIEINLCLHPKDIELNKKFKQLETDTKTKVSKNKSKKLQTNEKKII